MINGAIYESRISSTNQWNIGFTEEISFNCRRCSYSSKEIRGFQDAGISIHSTSAAGKTNASDSRTKGGLHGETTYGSGAPFQKTGEIKWRILEQISNTCFRIFSPTKTAWLRKIVRSKCSIILIGWLLENFHKSIDFWFQRRISFLAGKKYV